LEAAISPISAESAAPWLFVVLWSTGFIGAKYGLPYTGPFTYLFIRLLLASICLVVISLLAKAAYPRRVGDWGHVALSGLLLHGGYLGGVFYALSRGMPAGLSSLVVGLQPILTAVVVQLAMREHVSARHWFGLLIGFIGVGLVVEEKVAGSLDGPIAHSAFVSITIALLSTTAGALYQKRHVRTVHLAVAASIQYMAAGAVLGVLAFSFESMQVNWTWQFRFALAWQVLALSVGANLLLLGLIRRRSVARISSLMYLVPPLTAIEAYFVFGERLGVVALAGMAFVVIGVAMVMRRPAKTTL
jgi:drug/metabolite transporter (DMT)-like permease